MQVIIDNATLSTLFNGISEIFQSLLPIIIVFIAIQLSFYIARKIISLMPKSNTRRVL